MTRRVSSLVPSVACVGGGVEDKLHPIPAVVSALEDVGCVTLHGVAVGGCMQGACKEQQRAAFSQKSVIKRCATGSRSSGSGRGDV